MLKKAIKTIKCLQISKYFPPVVGGIETVVYELSEGLSAYQHFEIEVICSNKNYTTQINNWNYRIVRCGNWLEIFSVPITPFMIYYLLFNRKQYDIIHVQFPNPIAGLALYLSRPQAKIVIHWQCDIVRQKKLLWLYAPLQNWLLRRAALIIATTEPYSKSSPWLSLYEEKLKIIPLGISDPLEKNKQYASITTNKFRRKYKEKHIIFTLGRLVYYKGFEVLIQSLSLVNLDVALIIGGSGIMLNELKEAARIYGVSDRIYFVGEIPQDELRYYYQMCDIFCFPSIARTEAFGLAMVEAMAYSKPVIATNVLGSGMAWINQHEKTGLNVTPGRPEELAEAIVNLLNNHKLSLSYGHAGRKRYEQEFTSNLMVDRISDAYMELLK